MNYTENIVIEVNDTENTVLMLEILKADTGQSILKMLVLDLGDAENNVLQEFMT